MQAQDDPNQEQSLTIHNEDFQAWMKRPETKIFLKFLDDYADYCADTIKKAVRAGHAVSAEYLADATKTCGVINTILASGAEHINDFYQAKAEEEADGKI